MSISKKELLIASLISLLYLSWFYFVVELRTEHLFILLVGLITYFIGGKFRKILIAFSPFIIYLIAYDSLRAFPNYLYNDLSIKEIYDFDKQLFGVEFQGKLLTLNEYLFNFQNSVLDFISGACYLTWVPLPIGFALYLFASNQKKIFVYFSFLFVLTNLLGFVGYFIYPAAPPWYVEMYGFEFLSNVTGEAARLSNFDQLIGVPIFDSIYSKNANVFAAVPSIHAANPLTCFIASLRLKNNWIKIIFFLITCGMWFGAIYSNHHYLIDVLCGALTVILAFVILSLPFSKKIMNRFSDIISEN